MKLQFHEGHGTTAAVGLAKVISDNFSDLTLAVGPPRYYRSKGILMLPGIPAGEIPRETRVRLLAFLSHEAWERRWSEWDPLDPRWWSTDPARKRLGLRALVNALNDARIDALGAEEFPGAGMHVRTVLREDYKALVRKYRLGTLNPSIRNVAVMVRHLAERVVSYERAVDDLAGYRPFLERLEPILRTLDLSSTDRVVEQAMAMYAALVDGVPGRGEKREYLSEGGESEMASAPEIPESREGDHDTEQETLDRITNDLFPGQDFERKPKRFDDPAERPRVYTYDPSRDKVYSPSIRNAVPVDPEVYRPAAEALTVRLRQALSTNLPQPLRRQTRGEVDERELHRLVLGHPDVFEARRPQEAMSTTAVISWDESNTMGGERIEQVSLLAHAWNEALGRLRIPTLLHGWTTLPGTLNNFHVYRQEALRHRIYRDFEERWDDPKVLRRLAKIDTGDGTPTGEALLYGAEALSIRPEKRKLLFFLTDGEPQIAAHGSEKVHHDFIRTVLERSGRAGIEVIGIGIQADLSHLFERWVRLDTEEDIYLRASDELVRVLRRAR